MVPQEVAMLQEEEKKQEKSANKVHKSRALKLNHKTNSKANAQPEPRSHS
jgi:hypothetical protein